MIPVSDLLKWADEHAIGRSPSYPRGWVSAKDILVLARMVEAKDPEACQYRKIVPNRTLKRRMVYRGAVYNAIEAERINHLDGILTDRYKDGFHDGLKRALEILGRLPDAEEGE